MIFNSILIANRGEIACRIIKTAKEMGIRSVAVYVDADKDALFVKQADQSVRLEDGGYLDGNQIIDAAIKTGAIDYLPKPAEIDQIYDALTSSEETLPPPPENPMTADRIRWEHIQRVFILCKRNVSETARRLRMHRRTLQRILNKHAPRE